MQLIGVCVCVYIYIYMNFTEKSVVFLALVTKVEDDSGGIGDLSPPVAAWSPSSMLHAGLRQSTQLVPDFS